MRLSQRMRKLLVCDHAGMWWPCCFWHTLRFMALCYAGILAGALLWVAWRAQ